MLGKTADKAICDSNVATAVARNEKGFIEFTLSLPARSFPFHAAVLVVTSPQDDSVVEPVDQLLLDVDNLEEPGPPVSHVGLRVKRDHVKIGKPLGLSPRTVGESPVFNLGTNVCVSVLPIVGTVRRKNEQSSGTNDSAQFRQPRELQFLREVRKHGDRVDGIEVSPLKRRRGHRWIDAKPSDVPEILGIPLNRFRIDIAAPYIRSGSQALYSAQHPTAAAAKIQDPLRAFEGTPSRPKLSGQLFENDAPLGIKQRTPYASHLTNLQMVRRQNVNLWCRSGGNGSNLDGRSAVRLRPSRRGEPPLSNWNFRLYPDRTQWRALTPVTHPRPNREIKLRPRPGTRKIGEKIEARLDVLRETKRPDHIRTRDETHRLTKKPSVAYSLNGDNRLLQVSEPYPTAYVETHRIDGTRGGRGDRSRRAYFTQAWDSDYTTASHFWEALRSKIPTRSKGAAPQANDFRFLLKNANSSTIGPMTTASVAGSGIAEVTTE